MIVSGIVLGGAVVVGHEANAAEWKANKPEQIQIVNGQKEYALKFGDTLWAIGQKINVNHVKLAEINGINLNTGEQYRLPIGRVISFDGNVATVKESNGKVVSQAVIKDKDKMDASKPVDGSQSPQTQNNGQATTPAPTQAGNQDGKPVEQPINDGNQAGQGGAKAEIPSQSTDTTGQAEKPGTATEPQEPSKPADKPIEPETPVAPEKDTTPINVGNSGEIFNTREEADAYGRTEIEKEGGKWYMYGYEGFELFNKSHEQLGTWSINFYNPETN